MLKLQYFGHLMRRANILEKTLMLGKVEGRRRRGWQGTRRLDGITDSMDMNLSKFWEIVKEREAWCSAVHGVSKSWTCLSNWTTAEEQGPPDKPLSLIIIAKSMKKHVKETISTWSQSWLPPATCRIELSYEWSDLACTHMCYLGAFLLCDNI